MLLPQLHPLWLDNPASPKRVQEPPRQYRPLGPHLNLKIKHSVYNFLETLHPTCYQKPDHLPKHNKTNMVHKLMVPRLLILLQIRRNFNGVPSTHDNGVHNRFRG